MHYSSTKFIKFNPRGCKGCWLCIDQCPVHVIGKVRFLFHRHAIILRPDACIGCGQCVKTCPKNCFSSADNR